MTHTLPTPAEVCATFRRRYATDPALAVQYLYNLGISSTYIKTEAFARNIYWTSRSPYGTLECTINLSKPEKDPRAIAAAGAGTCPHAPDIAPARNASRIPRCDLCWENEEFPGTPEHPAKPGLRIVPITLGGERWGLQYSPYAYFPEHCIALSEHHRPMKIDAAGFERLLDFVDQFPFYFIGSNADLPIVGGSILSHDHFQGGRHTFPLMKAPLARAITLAALPQVQAGVVKWPASVVRLMSDDRGALAQAAVCVLDAWHTFCCEPCAIVAFDADGQHNTLNPIVHREGTTYVMDLVLRNNRTNEAHPWGIFHPNEKLHHLKKENIGLIEIMGLAILPPRLARELPAVQRILIEAAHDNLPASEVLTRLQAGAATAPHATWAAEIYQRRTAEFAGCSTPSHTLHPVIQQEVAYTFTTILETTGVFKQNEIGQAGWNAFINEFCTTTRSIW